MLTVVTAPVSLPVTLDEARAYLQLPDDLIDQDDLIDDWILESCQLVEAVTGLTLIATVYDYTIDAFPSVGVIHLPRGPVSSIASVTSYDDAAVATVLSSTTAYYTALGDDGRVLLRDGGAWPSDVRSGQAGVIRFTAGYGTTAASVPEPLRGMIRLLVKRRYDGVTEAPDWADIGPYLPVAV